MSPKDVSHRITSRTKGILVPHYGGYPADIAELVTIAREHRVALIEDASDALGARYLDRWVGSFGDFAAFSLASVHQITAIEGGLLVTKQEVDFERARRRRWFGIDRIRRKPNIQGYYDFDVTEVGYGYHLTDVNASVALAHCLEIDAILGRRRLIAARYREGLAKVPGLQLFASHEDREGAYQTFGLHVERREDFCRAMRGNGIDVSIVHERNDINSVFGGRRSDLPGLDRFEKTNICIPIYQGLTDDEVARIVTTIAKGW